MEFSEKDAARSKFKLSQKHRKGRGRGRGAAGRGGGSRGSTSGAAAQDLGTNEDRYHDEEAEQAAAAAATGPVQQSQGADLAELLSQAEPFDRGFYYRSKVNLAQEMGLPPEPEASSYQGLSIDLKGLSACLELLPKNWVLDTDAFSDEDVEAAGDEWAAEGTGEGELLPDLDDELALIDIAPMPVHAPALKPAEGSVVGREQEQMTIGAPAGKEIAVAAGAGLQAAAAPAAPQAAAAVRAGRAPAPAAVVAAPVAPARAVSGSQEGVDDLLSELLGETATISSATQQQERYQLAALPLHVPAVSGGAQVRAVAAQPANASRRPVGEPPSHTAMQQRQQQQTVSILQQQPASQAFPVEDHDAELDLLLGLAAGPGPVEQRRHAQPGGSGSEPPQAQGQSLEDWLEGL